MREITVLEGMLLDEYYRSERNLKVNIRELKKLNAKGVLTKESIDGVRYICIRWRDGLKKKTKYIREDDAYEIEQKYKLKRRWEENVRTLKHDMKILRKALGRSLIRKYRGKFK